MGDVGAKRALAVGVVREWRVKFIRDRQQHLDQIVGVEIGETLARVEFRLHGSSHLVFRRIFAVQKTVDYGSRMGAIMNLSQQQPDREPPSQDRFLRLFLASERELLRYVMALAPRIDDAREIVQQTAVVLWEKFDQYDPSLPFTPWACRFALNISKQWLARQQRWRAILDQNLAEQLLQRRAEMLPEMDARLRHLDSCLGKLPGDQRAIVDGYYFRQLGIDVIAEETHRSVEALYKALQRIRKALQDCIVSAERSEVAT